MRCELRFGIVSATSRMHVQAGTKWNEYRETVCKARDLDAHYMAHTRRRHMSTISDARSVPRLKILGWWGAVCIGTRQNYLHMQYGEPLCRGDDTVGNPHRAQIDSIRYFRAYPLIDIRQQLPVEQFEVTVSQSAAPSPLLIHTRYDEPPRLATWCRSSTYYY